LSIPPHGRALPFPLAWGRKEERDSITPIVSEPVRPSDEELMARIQASDSSALDILFDRYSRLVLSVATSILHDRGEAEDLVQEAFLRLYQKGHLFNPSKGSARAWIIQLAFHRALDKKSYLARRGFYVGTDLASVADTLSGETDLDREVAGKLDRAQLEKAFRELPDRQRQTLELFYFEGLELREISERLHEPLPNVRHHFYRGLEKLRKSAFLKGLR
jgi:RNA polymerase sigma-70 factor (ECF subfamily)